MRSTASSQGVRGCENRSAGVYRDPSRAILAVLKRSQKKPCSERSKISRAANDHIAAILRSKWTEMAKGNERLSVNVFYSLGTIAKSHS